MAEDFPVVLSAGSLRAEAADGWVPPPVWTEEGVVVTAAPHGAGPLQVSVALCVLNDLFREARQQGPSVSGARAAARGELDEETWQSTGITYEVQVDSPASAEEVTTLLRHVDAVAEIPRTLRGGTPVERADG
ncbi:MAG TPA: OsmC family protein [Nocardioides sp.]|uniref:OsmC family protein n=1 Tax=Nocardioides sp. TaxID=35761 RepID=UPI002E332D33|nr:OsmC family protein [Nocardioides sp.]HEX3931494.1 OsmC family protein [Nocardioides sp.]